MEETLRLKIYSLTEDHAVETYEKLQNPEIYLYIPDSAPPDVESLTKHYSMLAMGSSIPSEEWLNWVMYEKVSGSVVGTLQSTVMTEEDAAYIAYVLFPGYWDMGYGFEGVQWMNKHLQEKWAIGKIVAEIDTRNSRSIKLIEKHGFERLETVPTEEGEDHVYEKNLS